VRLERILESVLYYSSGQEEELARFYGEVLGLQATACCFSSTPTSRPSSRGPLHTAREALSTPASSLRLEAVSLRPDRVRVLRPDVGERQVVVGSRQILERRVGAGVRETLRPVDRRQESRQRPRPDDAVGGEA
jgi:hypothetical protein